MSIHTSYSGSSDSEERLAKQAGGLIVSLWFIENLLNVDEGEWSGICERRSLAPVSNQGNRMGGVWLEQVRVELALTSFRIKKHRT